MILQQSIRNRLCSLITYIVVSKIQLCKRMILQQSIRNRLCSLSTYLLRSRFSSVSV